jgi:hypothetical protein
MKKLMMTAALLAVPVLALADPGNGVDMTWNSCVGAASAATNKNFVCTGTANQNYLLVIQFKTATPFTQAAAWTATMDYINDTNDLGDNVTGFWRHEQNCPGNNIDGLLSSHTPPLGCTVDDGISNVSDDGGAGLSGVAWFSNTTTNGSPMPGRAKISSAFARADGIVIDPGLNYYVMHLIFNNRNRTACPDGCTDPGAIVLNDMKIESFDAPEAHLDGVDKLQNCATIGVSSPGSCAATPVQNKTWGKLKSMYR